MKYEEIQKKQLNLWLPEFLIAGFSIIKVQNATVQKRGIEYVLTHEKLSNLLGVKSDMRYYLKRFSDDGEKNFGLGLNAQKVAGEKLENLSRIIANATDSFRSSQFCWKEEKLAEVLDWIKENI